MAGASSKTNPPMARKRVEAETNSLKRARDGSAFTRCEACNKTVPVVLIDMHSCSLDSKIRMSLESQVVEKATEVKKPVDRKRATPADCKERKGKKEKKSKDPKSPKRPPTAFFLFMDDFRKQYKEAHPDSKSGSTVTKEGGEKWKTMTDEERKPYVNKAAELKAEYEKEKERLNEENEEKGPSLAKELDSGSRNEDGVGYNTSTAKKALLQSMLSALLDDPILSDVPKKPTLADVDTLINLELGSAMKISIVKMDNTSFDVAALNSATVKDLKLAIRKKINELEQARMGHRHISWRHIWANFCLVHHNEKLIDDNSLLRDNGIRNNSKVIFSPYVMSRESQKHSRRRTHRLFRRSCIELQASFF